MPAQPAVHLMHGSHGRVLLKTGSLHSTVGSIAAMVPTLKRWAKNTKD